MDRRTATHEAGHAVGRLITAEIMGYAPEEAVAYITRSVCYGPFSSKNHQTQVETAFRAGGGADEGKLWDILASTGTAQERIISMLCRLLFITMGAAAEARLARLSEAGPVWQLPACEYDRNDFSNSLTVLRMAGGEAQTGSAEEDFLRHATFLMRHHEVWSAVNAIAFELRDTRSDMPGVRVAELATPFLISRSIQPLPPGWLPS